MREGGSVGYFNVNHCPAAITRSASFDEIYTGILRNAVPVDVIEDERQCFCNVLRAILGTLAVLCPSLSVPSLAPSFCLPDYEVFDTLHDLHSMIDVFQRPAQTSLLPSLIRMGYTRFGVRLNQIKSNLFLGVSTFGDTSVSLKRTTETCFSTSLHNHF
jgi:hypothetical protein